MAELTQDQVRLLFREGGGARAWSLFALQGVSGNDTVDLTSSGVRKVNQAVLMSDSGAALPAVGLPGGAVVAIPSGLADQGAYLLVDGTPA